MQDIGTTGVVMYTTRAQRVFGYAREEAMRRGQGFIGPEHLLLGLLHESDNLACQTLERLAVPAGDLRTWADARMPTADSFDEPGADIDVSLTPRAHRTIALAYSEAQRLRHTSVGTEHLLLGLVREREGLPGRLLARAGVDLERAQKIVMSLTGGRPMDFTSTSPPSRPEVGSIQGLLAALRHDGRSGKPILGLEWLVAYFFAALMLMLVLLRAAPWDDDWSFVLYVAFCVGVLRAIYLVINKMVASPKQRQAAQRLAQLHDKRLVGHLVDFATWPDEGVRIAAKQALIEMLPHLQPSDVAFLSPTQQGVLRSYLHRRYVESDRALQIAILKGYEQIGDEQAIPAVSALATMRPRTESRRRVRVAAEECLPFLQQRRQRQQSSQTLLRATALNVAEPPREVLLRSAGLHANTNPDELLRTDVGDVLREER